MQKPAYNREYDLIAAARPAVLYMAEHMLQAFFGGVMVWLSASNSLPELMQGGPPSTSRLHGGVVDKRLLARNGCCVHTEVLVREVPDVGLESKSYQASRPVLD